MLPAVFWEEGYYQPEILAMVVDLIQDLLQCRHGPLKIGGDASSSSTTEAMIGAMDAAVTIYDADILSMSYGGWYYHHDGSSATEQKVDWVYSMGKPFFISAGNSADDDRHYSGTVAANSSTNYIQVMFQESHLQAPINFYLILSRKMELAQIMTFGFYFTIIPIRFFLLLLMVNSKA